MISQYFNYILNNSRTKNIFFDKGLILVLLLSMCVLFVFFGKLLIHPNVYYFSVVGDGIQVYYNALFHVFYDKGLLTEGSMNYPYEESVFFTGCNPILTTIIKYLGLKYYTIGILNLSMLFSIPVSALFIYLIFKEYEVNYLFASIAAVSIAFLSPQLNRMLGHYNLAYCFSIPVTIWLMLKFYKKQSLKKSIIISLYCFFLASIHMYLFIFSGLIIIFVWAALFMNISLKNFLLMFVKNFFIQLVLPYVLIQLLIRFSLDISDRTSYPFGFFDYHSNLNGVFYPFGRAYEEIFRKVGLAPDVHFEGAAFIGISGLIFFCFLIVKTLFYFGIFKFKKAFNFLGDSFLNTLFICSIIFLLFSFCFPFKYGYEDLIFKLSFLRQFRALGRFTWIFFYVINILLVIYVNRVSGVLEKLNIKYIFMVLIGICLAYDSYCNIVELQGKMSNNFNSLTDFENKSDENRWVSQINFKNFQAVMPLPYFNIGSENFSFETNTKTFNNTCIVSFKTGLPMISVYNSRISLEHTFNCIQLFKQPTGKIPVVINELTKDKDILLIVEHDLCSDIEKKIISYAKFILKTKDFELYKISLIDFKRYYTESASNIHKEFAGKKLYQKHKFLVSDSTLNFVSIDYENLNKETGYREGGIQKRKIVDYVCIADTCLKINNFDGNYTLSFWIKNLDKDILPRSGIEIKAVNNKNETYSLIYSNLMGVYKQIDNKWTLIEHTFKLQNTSDKIKVVLWNFNIKDEEYFIIDDFLLKPEILDVFLKTDSCIYKNNKVYYYN